MTYNRYDNGSEVLNVSSYLKDLLQATPFSKIYVGTDSQNVGSKTIFATVIVLHFNTSNGGHCIYSKDIVPRIKDKYTRLWGEVQRSVDAANYLKHDCKIDVSFIDLDLNANVKEESNRVLASAVGLCEQQGFSARYKPGPAYAVRIADVICRPVSKTRIRKRKKSDGNI